MTAAHRKTSWAFLAWLVFFTPSLLAGLDAKAVGHMLLAVLAFWPLLALRPLQIPLLVGLTLLGGMNILHASYFGNLADEFFLATALRTTPDETAEFLTTLPLQAVLGCVLWLIACVMAGRYLWRTLPGLWGQSPWLRKAWWGAGVFWLAVLGYSWGKHLNANTFMRKAKSLYPLHAVRAVMRQQDIADALFTPPQLPSYGPSGPQVDTLVVVLGESATAQRWSLLGYGGAPTNEPLAQVQGLHTSAVLAQGWNTAAALPYMLTGMSAHDSAMQRAPSFIDLARRAGYKTFTFTNSRFFSSKEDFFSVTLRRASDVYQKVGNGGYDEVLTRYLDTALADPAPRKLIVLHTYGSHFEVEGRFPSEFAQFRDDYDNSLLYSSHLLAQWIGQTARSQPQGSAMLLYTSDHGVLVPPCASDYRHGAGLSSFEVPMLVWHNAAVEAALLPDFAQPGGNAPAHTNALLAETAIRAVGYGAWLAQAHWPASTAPAINGVPWAQLKERNACTLQ